MGTRSRDFESQTNPIQVVFLSSPWWLSQPVNVLSMVMAVRCDGKLTYSASFRDATSHFVKTPTMRELSACAEAMLNIFWWARSLLAGATQLLVWLSKETFWGPIFSHNDILRLVHVWGYHLVNPIQFFTGDVVSWDTEHSWHIKDAKMRPFGAWELNLQDFAREVPFLQPIVWKNTHIFASLIFVSQVEYPILCKASYMFYYAFESLRRYCWHGIIEVWGRLVVILVPKRINIPRLNRNNYQVRSAWWCSSWDYSGCKSCAQTTADRERYVS